MNQAPPKLQQLLQQMPDVDKVKLLQLAHHYGMDLDDPGFLPLLLTQQGIEALESAKNNLVREAGGTVTFALSQAQKAFDDSAKAKADDLENLKSAALVKIDEYASESEIALKSAVEKWSFKVFSEAVLSALNQHIPTAMSAAELSAIQSAETLNKKINALSVTATEAAETINNATKNIRIIWLLITLLFGLLVGSGVGYFAAAKVAHSERIDTEQITQNIQKFCIKK